ncbi:MAG: HAD family hydrolase [Acidimicrobiales bacterium]|nr:HAD family hydrolase [Acidimicrobiales bacterium]
MPLALFDLDNTLIDRVTPFKRWARAFAAQYDLPAAAEAWLIDADDGGAIHRDAFFDLVQKRFDLDESTAVFQAAYEREFPRFMRIDDETVLALQSLRREGWRIGIVTNGPAMQTLKIEHCGLPALVDGWVVSLVDGVSKPDPAAFALAAERAGGSLDGAWMIGDSPGSDIGGAHRAGLSSIWLHRLREWELTEYQPTRVAFSCAEAVNMLLDDDLHLPFAVGR